MMKMQLLYNLIKKLLYVYITATIYNYFSVRIIMKVYSVHRCLVDTVYW